MTINTRTDHPILLDRMKITKTIANFWDQISPAWRTIWGPHIHHGYYENDKPLTPLLAQEKLIEKLAAVLVPNQQDRILDVGCGMGGSSIYLAKRYQATVTGITLSSKQLAMATEQARIENIEGINFKIEDALVLSSFTDNSFDIVWSLESCEQFYDKKLFLKHAYRVLKPGGKLMLATWCSDREEYHAKLAKQYQKLCLAFDLPYMPTINHYNDALIAQGFNLQEQLDWTSYVAKSWDIGVSLVNAYNFLKILSMAGWRGLRFAKQIKLMQEAFQQGQVRYGVFVASK